MEDYVKPDDIPFIRNLAISSIHHYDTFYGNYTRNGQYTVKSEYWVAPNLLKTEEGKEVLEPNITKLQVFVWKIKTPTKTCYLI